MAPDARGRRDERDVALHARAGERHGRDFADYDELWRWSVDELEDFWAEVWEFCGVLASRPYERVLAPRKMPGARWFAGAELNYAENLLLARRRAPADPRGRGAAHLRAARSSPS